ncbi:hypothetical protein CERZMDRAFT_82816 [Cercospora zeae-maydis SCOH1-5]|uniref:Uncharacterized protein n=1 Tax=Cercospora zeae-maydis SCOH1-5 TaxID=717836 RepID=A0A6A6FN78_9PEZI|nr:hypothetical protein CERZMDRAFT_82816 [Cercospora zeae-maydis SCOH1-5]
MRPPPVSLQHARLRGDASNEGGQLGQARPRQYHFLHRRLDGYGAILVGSKRCIPKDAMCGRLHIRLHNGQGDLAMDQGAAGLGKSDHMHLHRYIVSCIIIGSGIESPRRESHTRNSPPQMREPRMACPMQREPFTTFIPRTRDLRNNTSSESACKMLGRTKARGQLLTKVKTTGRACSSAFRWTYPTGSGNSVRRCRNSRPLYALGQQTTIRNETSRDDIVVSFRLDKRSPRNAFVSPSLMTRCCRATEVTSSCPNFLSKS